MRRGVLALTLALAPVVPIVPGALATGGCDGGEWSFSLAPGDAGAPDARYEAACAAWATGYCAFEDSCPQYGVRWNSGQCVPRMTLRCELIAQDPGVSFDPARTAACAEPDAGDCSQAPPGMCVGRGSRPAGAACVWDEACASGFCLPVFGSESQRLPCGLCIAQPCGGGCPSGQVCEIGLDGGASCLVIASVGEPCMAPSDCASFFCATSGKCGALAHLGEPCADDGMAAPCGDPGTFCDSVKHVCRAVGYAGYGESCAENGSDFVECSGDGQCDITDGLCIPPADDGQFCDESQGLGCLAPAGCVAHVCTFPSLGACGLR